MWPSSPRHAASAACGSLPYGEVAPPYFGSVGKPPCSQASNPPASAAARKPRSLRKSAARALEFSFGQVQYVMISARGGTSSM